MEFFTNKLGFGNDLFKILFKVFERKYVGESIHETTDLKGQFSSCTFERPYNLARLVLSVIKSFLSIFSPK